MVEIVFAMIGLGIETEETVEEELREMIVGCLDVILGVMTTTDHHVGTGICSRVAWIETEGAGVVHHHEVTETNSQCKWVAGKRAQALHQRRRSPHLT